MEKIVSIFVEGPTDVEIYRTFLRECLNFYVDNKKNKKEKTTKRFLQVKIDIESLFPYENVRYLFKNNTVVLIQAKLGEDKLKNFAENVLESFEDIKRKINEVQGSLKIELKSFIIFDKKIPESLRGKEKFVPILTILAQPNLPEEIILNLVKHCPDICQRFEKLTICWKSLKSEGDEFKQKVNLLKSLIGERCHAHLLEELIKFTQGCDLVKSLLPQAVLEIL